MRAGHATIGIGCVACLLMARGGAAYTLLGAAPPRRAALPPRLAAAAATAPSAALARAPHMHRAVAPRLFSEPPPDSSPEDVFEELTEELSQLQRILIDMSPRKFRASQLSLTALTGLAAWFLTPGYSKVLASLTVGAAGAGGQKLGRMLAETRRTVVPAAIAQLVQEQGVRELDAADVAALAKRYDVPAERFEEQLQTVYGRYLNALASEPDAPPKASEIGSLAALRKGLSLGWNATSAAHVAEAAAVTGPPSGRLSGPLKKLLWLSEGLFATSRERATTAALRESLSLSSADAQALIDELSAPLYRAAVTQAVGTYNRTEAPAMLQTVRRALCLSEPSAQDVHAAMYEAQLRSLLPAGSDAKLDDETALVLGELEGILQIRSAGERVMARTVPLYRSAVSDALAAALNDGAADPAAVWASLVTRQRELRLRDASARPVLVEEARKIAAEQLALAAELEKKGQTDRALAQLGATARYGRYMGEILELGERSADAGANLAEQYLGALTVDPSLEGPAQALLQKASADEQVEGLREGRGLLQVTRAHPFTH